MSGFRALVLEEKDGKVAASLQTLTDDRLPEGDVTVAVTHSTLNYKDGLVMAGIGRLVRQYPHVPGIDFTGVVEQSASPRFRPGDKVLLTGWGVGERHWGGYAQKARVKSDWLLKLPDGLSPARAMALGTAGFTAMLAIIALERRGLTPAAGEVLVTGAAGGLGSVAIAVLARLGYTVAASTGRPTLHEHLKKLGAKIIVDRAEIGAAPARPLLSERWAGCVDGVGGATLANVLAALKRGASVAACGNAGGNEVPANMIPLLLRGVSLLGIDSSMKSNQEREEAWGRLVRDLQGDVLDSITTTIGLGDLAGAGGRILKGDISGRLVVDLAR